MIKDLAYTQLREAFKEELILNPLWTISDLICWVMSELAITSAIIFKDSYSDEDYETLRIRLIQTVDLISRFASVSDKVDVIQKRSNIHALLHLIAAARMFGTLVNINCSPGEAKHGPFKEMARQSNKKEVPKQMLSKVSRTFRISSVVEGAFEKDYPDLTSMLQNIKAQCPTLFKRMVAAEDELDIAEEPDEREEAVGDTDFFDTDKVEARELALIRGIMSSLDAKAPIKETRRNKKIFPSRLVAGHWLREKVREAVEHDPANRIPINYKPFSIR